MSEIIPFRAVRPPRDKVHLVASRSYVTYNDEQLHQKLSDNPFSFIHIINPEFGSGKRTAPNSPERFELIKEKYQEFIDKEYLVQEDKPCFYIYRQSTPTDVFTGIVCGVSIKEYLEGRIKIHEHTITNRVVTFTDYLDICDYNAEPVLLTYPHAEIEFKELIVDKLKERAEYDFTTTNMNRHELWIIDSDGDIALIQNEFKKLDSLYIADGHHRMASSVNLAENRRVRGEATEEDICNYALAMIMPDDILRIDSFHRLIRPVAEINEEDFITTLKKDFEVEDCSECYIPPAPHQFGMRLESGWYSLKLKTKPSQFPVVQRLDPVILTTCILEPIFKIFDQKTDDRISFIPSIEDISRYENAIQKGDGSILFTLHPVSPEELFDVANAGEVMPPKSTYVLPKLRSGLTMMKLS